MLSARVLCAVQLVVPAVSAQKSTFRRPRSWRHKTGKVSTDVIMTVKLQAVNVLVLFGILYIEISTEASYTYNCKYEFSSLLILLASSSYTNR